MNEQRRDGHGRGADVQIKVEMALPRSPKDGGKSQGFTSQGPPEKNVQRKRKKLLTIVS
jgi:hypothetical protein